MIDKQVKSTAEALAGTRDGATVMIGGFGGAGASAFSVMKGTYDSARMDGLPDDAFGGGRASGTNDKAGSLWNLIRWVSPRTIKETFAPPTDFRYPYMQEP